MNLQLLREELERYEGVQYKVYLDSLGLKTAGIGHLLVGKDADMVVGMPVTKEQVEKWYEADIVRCIFIAKSATSNFNSLDDTRQRVLTQLAFNMGNRLLGFKKCLTAVEQMDFKKAADELQNSKWFTQVGRRGPETCFAMRTGNYGWR